MTFINERIFSEAKSLIRFTDFSIAEIAYQLNFRIQLILEKIFKKYAHQTPMEFRKGK